MEDHHMATRDRSQTPFPLRGRPASSRTPRLLAGRTASGRVAAYRMAERRRRADEILVFDAATTNKAQGSGCCRKATVDYRTGLSGTETGTRVGPLRRPRLARLPSSRHAVHCRLRVPGRGAEPFSPLS